MPPKYSHIKKRPPSAAKPKRLTKQLPGAPSPHADRAVSQAVSAVSELERAIARVLLVRYEQDVARLFSTHLFTCALVHLPTLALRCVGAGGPGWLAANANSDELKDFFRAVIGMELRQAGERVATKSVLWSYTALRHFALSNDVPVCRKRGLHSAGLLPHFDALRAYVDTLERAPPPAFARPPSLGPLTEGLLALEEACELRLGAPARARDRYVVKRRGCTHCGHAHAAIVEAPRAGAGMGAGAEEEEPWRAQVRAGYERLAQTLWRVAREFDVRGYGLVLREKLEKKWCACGCSTDHLGEVCERTVQEEEDARVRVRAAAERRAASGKGVDVHACAALSGAHRGAKGKEREWDGRGSGVFGWGTEEEEDVWELELDFGPAAPDDGALDADEREMTVGELVDWRYFKAEREKERGNAEFKRGEYACAIEHYSRAAVTEPELPHYQLNIAAAHLKLSQWVAAEAACTLALSQHRSGKGYFRRAKARRMLGRGDEAIKDLRAALRIQPTNAEALAELAVLLPLPPTRAPSLPKPNIEAVASRSSMTASTSSNLSTSSTSRSSHISSSSSGISVSASSAASSSYNPPADSHAEARRLQITFTPTTVNLPPRARPGVSQERMTFVVPSWERYVVKRMSG